jgi:periodic tryptophan protein 2
MKTGRLLDVLSGHQGPVSGLQFNPLQPVLASSSWDKTVKLWDVFETKAATMTFEHASDVLCVAFRPDGKELAASSLDGHILVWNAIDGEQSGMIEARRDVAGGRKDSDKSTFAAQAASSCFSALCYSADGEALIAGGNTKWVCIYNVARRLCVKKFAISENRSLDGVASQLNSKRMTEAGPLAEIDHDSNDECGDVGDRRDDSLPGVARGAHAKRRRPAARTHSTRFAPSGRSWAAATTEGLLIFSLDQVPAEPPPCLPQREHQTTFFNECSANAWQVSSFDPLDLSLDVTPARIFESLEACNWLDALLMALRLNEAPVLRAVYQRVPVAEIPLLAAALPEPYLKRMLQLIAAQTADSPHFELGLRWAEHLLLNHHDGIAQARASYAPVLRAVHQAFSVQMTDLAKLCHSNHYALAFLAPSHVGLVEPTAMARVEKGEK